MLPHLSIFQNPYAEMPAFSSPDSSPVSPDLEAELLLWYHNTPDVLPRSNSSQPPVPKRSHIFAPLPQSTVCQPVLSHPCATDPAAMAVITTSPVAALRGFPSITVLPDTEHKKLSSLHTAKTLCHDTDVSAGGNDLILFLSLHSSPGRSRSRFGIGSNRKLATEHSVCWTSSGLTTGVWLKRRAIAKARRFCAVNKGKRKTNRDQQHPLRSTQLGSACSGSSHSEAALRELTCTATPS